MNQSRGAHRAYYLARELGESWQVVCRVLGLTGSVTSVLSDHDATVIRQRWADVDDANKESARVQVAREREEQRRAWRDEDEFENPGEYAPDPMPASEMWRFQRNPSVLRKWVQRGYLRPVETRGRTNFYALADVRRVLAETADRTKRAPTPTRNVPDLLRGSELVDAQRAALLAHVSEATIRVWVHRGRLKPVMKDGRKALFRADDLLAERNKPGRRVK